MITPFEEEKHILQHDFTLV